MIRIQVSVDISSGITCSFMIIEDRNYAPLLIILLKNDRQGHRIVVMLEAAGVSPCHSVQATGLPILAHRKQSLEEVEL